MGLKQLWTRFRAWQKEAVHYSDESLEVHHCPNCGHDFEQNLTVVYERGNWFIDDMYDGTMRQRIIDELKRYKKEGIVPRIK